MSLLKRLERWIDQKLCGHPRPLIKFNMRVKGKEVKVCQCMECGEIMLVERGR